MSPKVYVPLPDILATQLKGIGPNSLRKRHFLPPFAKKRTEKGIFIPHSLTIEQIDKGIFCPLGNNKYMYYIECNESLMMIVRGTLFHNIMY